jgi:hypothetical protein
MPNFKFKQRGPSGSSGASGARSGIDMLTFGIGLVFFFIMFITFTSSGSKSSLPSSSSFSSSLITQPLTVGPHIQPRPNTFFTDRPDDTLANPYAPPLKDVFSPHGIRNGANGGIPINMATNTGATVNASYQQIGLLTKADNGSNSSSGSSSDPVIMPLMGKPLFTSRDKWLFYTISDKNNSMKLPIIIKGRNALSEIGVDNVYTGDTVYVQGYNNDFKVTLYENSTPQYIPFI